MGNLVTVRYCGQNVIVTQEVADFLKESDHMIYLNNRKHDRRKTELKYLDQLDTLDPKHIGGRNYLLNNVIRNERCDKVREAVKALPENMQRLFVMRYERDYTEQQIADIEGVSKMAICKRLKKLHTGVKAHLPSWPENDFIVETCSQKGPTPGFT